MPIKKKNWHGTKESCVVFPEKGVGRILGKPAPHNVLAVFKKIQLAVTHLSLKSSYLGLEHGQPRVSGWVCPDCRAAGTFARIWGLAFTCSSLIAAKYLRKKCRRAAQAPSAHN